MSQSKSPSTAYTLSFIVVLCCACALVLSVLASALREPQEQAARVERSQQMLIAAQVYNPNGYFQMKDASGNMVPAKHVGDGVLAPGSVEDDPSGDDVLDVYAKRITSFLVGPGGAETTFAAEGIDEDDYIDKNWKAGFAKKKFKLCFRINPNPGTNSQEQAEGFIIPVSGFGLWGPIAGYLAMEPDGIHVMGIAWYFHGETPGLGAEIAEPWWQSLFPGKSVFLQGKDGNADLKTAPVGLTVVRGAVKDVYGDSPKANSAVDGMAGATLTGVGVTKAYKDALEAYRPFLIRINEATR